MKRSWTLRVLAVIWGLSGCAADTQLADAADDEATLDHVEALGYAREDVVLDDEHAHVQGDVLLERELLVQGAYEQGAIADGPIEKGYTEYSGTIGRGRNNIKLAFGTGAELPPRAVRDAFIAAAAAWSAIPGSTLRISTANTGSVVTVRWRTPANLPCTAGRDVCANPPSVGLPGRNIYVRNAPLTPGCGATWSGSNLLNMTRHEMGHTLGFAHPYDPRAQHVEGTSPGILSTIMDPTVAAGCVIAPTRLTQDDYATAAAVY
jgi:hypothetical protein